MSGREFLIDAVAQFLHSTAWLEAVAAFLETHFRKFLVADAKNGSSASQLDDSKATDSSGDDDNADAKKATQSHSLAQYDTFLLFKDLVERLLEQVVADLGCTGEDLVAVLEESARLGKHASVERQFFIKTLLSFESYTAFHKKISAFAAEKKASGAVPDDDEPGSEDVSPEYSEWILQLAIASSILEAKARGDPLDETEEGLVPWAEALLEMSSAQPALEATYEGEAKEEVAPVDDRMRELERTLIRERLKVDLLVAQRVADANAQMKQQMLHLVASEIEEQSSAEQLFSGTTEENELAGLFAQTETIQCRLKEVKARCFEFENVGQPEMDKMYLFLKEKVHLNQDLVSKESEIYEFIFTQIQESDAALVPLLLEWLLLESEGLRVQNQIQDQLNGARDEGHWVQDWDEGSKTFYYVHSVTNESKWEAPLCGYLDMNSVFVAPAWDGYGESPATEEYATEEAAEQPYAATDYGYGSSDTEQSSAQPFLNEATFQLDATLSQAGGGEDPSHLLEIESIMERISREHNEERRRLELLFQVEKARQKEELQKRKEKKRRERLLKSKAGKGSAIAADEGEAVATDASPSVVSARLLSPRFPPVKAETKTSPVDGGHIFSVLVPGHGRVDLTHLLSDSHAKRIIDKKGLSPLMQQQPQVPAQVMLNPSTLRYLTEKMMKRDPANWGQGASTQEIVIDKMNVADEK